MEENKPRIMYIKDESLLDKNKNKENDGYDEDIEDSDIGTYDEDDMDLMPKMLSEPFMMTEQGPIPIKHYLPNKDIYNFWIAHTNFSITKDIVDIINNTSGLETAEFISQYRCRLSVGKLFVPKNVFNTLNNTIFTYLKRLDSDDPKDYFDSDLTKPE